MSYPILFGNTAASAGGFPNPFPARYFILQPLANKGDGLIQMSEFWILNGGTRLGGTWVNWDLSLTVAQDAGNNNSPGSETPNLANDNNTSTKWLDFRGISGGLFMDIGSQQATTGYTWWTANDGPGRDLTSWRIWASKTNNNDWAPVSFVTEFNPTTSRFTQVGSWSWDSSLYG